MTTTLQQAMRDMVENSAKHLIAGTRLPDVALPATRGANVNLARFQERAIVFVYPMTGTPGLPNPDGWDDIPGAHGSTPQAESFRDLYGQFQLVGWDVFGVSSQPSSDQRAFAHRAGIPYLLLSDENFGFANALRLPRFTAGGTAFLTRLTFVVRNGVIYRTIYPISDPQGHAAQILSDMSAPAV